MGCYLLNLKNIIIYTQKYVVINKKYFLMQFKEYVYIIHACKILQSN